MKILLLNPQTPHFFDNKEYYVPLGLMYLSSVLKKDNHNVEILDLKTIKTCHQETHDKKILESLKYFKPDFVGINCFFSGNIRDVIYYSALVKKFNNNIKVVIGGIHPTIYSYDILNNHKCIDYVVLGEGEQSLLELVNGTEFNRINGFVYRNDDDIIENCKTKFIQNINDIPFPDYDSINLEKYYRDTTKWHNPKKLKFNISLPIITSRSCPNKCNFCSMYLVMGEKWRSRSPSNVVDEIEYLNNNYGCNHFSIMDDNFTLNKKRTLAICDEIHNRSLNIQFETTNGVNVNTLDEGVIDALVNVGMTRLYLAIETGSEYMRNEVMGKHVSNDKIYSVVDIAKRYNNLKLHVFILYGFPEETKETLNDTIAMIDRIKPDKVHAQHIIPFPKTAVYHQALKDDLFVDVLPENMYRDVGMYFNNWNRFYIKPYNLDLKELEQFEIRT